MRKRTRRASDEECDMVPALIGPVTVCGPRRCVRALGMIDTGAEISGVSARLARKLGLPTTGGTTIHTANGVTRRRVVWAEARLGSCARVRFAAIVQRPMRAEVLIGMNYLARAGVVVDTARGRIACRRR